MWAQSRDLVAVALVEHSKLTHVQPSDIRTERVTEVSTVYLFIYYYWAGGIADAPRR